MGSFLVRLFGRGQRRGAARHDDPFAQPEIAAMDPRALADLPLTHPMPDAASSAPASGRRPARAMRAPRAAARA